MINQTTEKSFQDNIQKQFRISQQGLAITFFLGFYVAFLISRWWQQVSAVPKLDTLCNQLNAHIHFSFQDKTNRKNIKCEKKFKRRIARYCLLGWTMCLSDLNANIGKVFTSKSNYLKKGLITIKESEQLAEGHDKNAIDVPRSKWFVPLNWAALAVKEVSMDKSNPLLIEHKYIVKEINRIQQKLLDLTRFQSYRMPHTINQVITIVVWVYFGSGIIGHQGIVTCGSEIDGGSGVNLGTALIMNFPLFEVVKYLLILGWFQVASYVSDPFGLDRYY